MHMRFRLFPPIVRACSEEIECNLKQYFLSFDSSLSNQLESLKPNALQFVISLINPIDCSFAGLAIATLPIDIVAEAALSEDEAAFCLFKSRPWPPIFCKTGDYVSDN